MTDVYENSGELYARRAAHEVAGEYPHLMTGEGFGELVTAIDAQSESTDEWWSGVRAASDDESNEGLAVMAASELDPGWIQERLSSGGEAEVLAVAGLLGRARHVVTRLGWAHEKFTTSA